MGKTKGFKRLRVGSYIRELSTVVIGVAITLFVSGLISASKEKKDLELQLDALYTESEDNLKRLNNIIEFYESHNKLKKFLVDYYYNPQPNIVDSIQNYRTVYTHTTAFSYKKGAYNMFVNSGAMKSLTDRNLLLRITEIYAMLEELDQQHEKFLDSKTEVFNDIYRMETKDIFVSDILSPKMQSVYNFHALYEGLDIQEKQIKKQIEELLLIRK